MSQAILEISGLTRRFGALRAVDGVDLRIEDGAITGLIGPNGAGKSTLFGVIAGEYVPSQGEIHFAERRISGLTPDRIFRAGLARTFQIPRPFPQMTVLENVMLVPLAQSGERFWNNWFRASAVRAEEGRLRDRAMEVLGFTGLAAKAADLAGVLSGGQQKLLELARILVLDPKAVLFDEPLAGMHSDLCRLFIDGVQEMLSGAVSIMLVCHDPCFIGSRSISL